MKQEIQTLFLPMLPAENAGGGINESTNLALSADIFLNALLRAEMARQLVQAMGRIKRPGMEATQLAPSISTKGANVTASNLTFEGNTATPEPRWIR